MDTLDPDLLSSEETRSWLTSQLDEAQRVQQAVRQMTPMLEQIARRLAHIFYEGGQVFFFGNGGSAADAQHWATELAGRFYQNRRALPAYALGTNVSQMTAVANDFGYENVFERPLLALSHPGDAAVGITTSGRSANVLRALEEAGEHGLITIGFTSRKGQHHLDAFCDWVVAIPSTDVARIQEGHELCGHLICSLVERMLFGRADDVAS